MARNVRDAVTHATAAVFVDGRRKGSAVLVDDRHLLTAEHVIASGGRLEVRFVSGSAAGVDYPVAPLDLVPGSSLDVAVLDAGDARPGEWPRPVSVWPARRLPREVGAFGFPSAEGPNPAGVWRQFAVAGTVGGGLVQLDWPGEVGTLPGHSGGPVVNADADSGIDGGLARSSGFLCKRGGGSV